MNQYFWNAYKRLEHEVLALAESIHVSDDQLKVYSEKIGDLLVRASIEAEALVKVLYHANGGPKPGGKDLYFDTDCFGLLESKWLLSKKTIFVTASNFYLQEEANKELRPLYKSYKRGTSSSDWQKAYQAVKHDRVHNLKSGNLRNLILAMGALYIINIYYRNSHFMKLTDLNGSNIDWSLGSDLFSVKISPETLQKSPRLIYEKKADYDECIYVIKYTDDSFGKFVEEVRKADQATIIKLLPLFLDKVRNDNISIKDGKYKEDQDLIDWVKLNKQSIFMEESKKNAYNLRKIYQEIEIEAVLNTQQFSDCPLLVIK